MASNKRGHHRSVDKELKPSVSWLESLSEVKKVVLNRVESARHSYPPGAIRYQMDALGGIKIKAYGGRGVFDIYVKVDAEDKEALLAKLRDRWNV